MPSIKLLNCFIAKLFKNNITTSERKRAITIKQFNHGFTLIELLVVISIIGILAAFAMVSFSSVQARTRDAQRKNDLDQITKALEMYKNDNGQYPGTEWVVGSSGGFWIPGLNSTYIKNIPVDPKRGTTWCVGRDDVNCFNYGYYSGGWCGLSGRDYILTARFEAYTKTDLSQQQYNNQNGSFCSMWSESPAVGIYVLSSP